MTARVRVQRAMEQDLLLEKGEFHKKIGINWDFAVLISIYICWLDYFKLNYSHGKERFENADMM